MHKQSVPENVYDAAIRFYIRESGDEDAATLKEWMERTHPEKHPARTVDQAFWALSLAASFGVVRVTT